MNTNLKLDDTQLSMISGAGESVDLSRGSDRAPLGHRQAIPIPRPATPPLPKGIDLVGEGMNGAGLKFPV